MSSSPAFPLTLPEFTLRFFTERTCREYLRDHRWPNGFWCPKDRTPAKRYHPARELWVCEKGHQISLTSGTTLHGTKRGLRAWFLAAYCMANEPDGIAAHRLASQMDLHLDTAHEMLKKLRARAKNPMKVQLRRAVQLAILRLWPDDASKHPRIAGAGLALCAVEASGTGASRIQFRALQSVDREVVREFLAEWVLPGSQLLIHQGLQRHISQDWGYDLSMASPWNPQESPDPLQALRDQQRRLLGWIRASHRRVSDKHLQGYLDEFSFRFNYWRGPELKFQTLLGIGPLSAFRRP